MPGIYDPNSEETNQDQVLAGRWECLRRNKDFRALSERWVKSEEFRRAHALSPRYHDLQHHTPRCAWDWMLTALQRTRLAEFQIASSQWFFDDEFNFGPIICSKNFRPAKVTKANFEKLFRVEPLPNSPAPITIDHSWDRTPAQFKQQFRIAYRSKHEFDEITGGLQEHGNQLARFASRLSRKGPIKDIAGMADYLFALGAELRELSEFCKVFIIPKRNVSEKRFKDFLGQIRNCFKTADLLTPTKTYDTHKSYQGTTEDWRWFLEAERLGLNVRKSADLAKLAKLYSEALRHRAMRGDAPRRAKAHGFTGSKFSSEVIKNRRITVKRHVLNIEKWIQAAYPWGTDDLA